ncbi:hypothetical protein KAR91_74965 [Candidatus Pacearchaeota archaeon]|nr:hypothetical protein [Candidatus Pacearchaeota archaeon]
MRPKKEPKLIREIKEITDNSDTHFWIKCKELTKIKTYSRPGSQKGERLIRIFFKTCAGRLNSRFESAYIRPYLDNWRDDHRFYDYVNEKDLNNDLTCKIGRQPRGIAGITKKLNNEERFANYIKTKYPDAFEEFEEIKKVSAYHSDSEMKETNDCAWQHIFGRRVSHYPIFGGDKKRRALWQTPKKTQMNRRIFDLDIEKAQADYNDLKKASKLPPRYLYNEVSLAVLQHDHKNHTYAIFRGYYITVDTVLHYDSSKVSHGLGQLVRTDRKVVIRNKRGIAFSKTLKTYAGNFILNEIEEHFGQVKKIKVDLALKQVQLNPKMEVVEIARGHGFRTFKRLFLGIHYDYCVLRGGITYHGTTLKQCYVGWKKKKALSKAGAKILNMKSARALGFCSSGIRQFCATNNIDSHDDYTVEEIKAIVNKNLSYNKTYYGRELRQVGVL